jgi:outer membrane protein, heavy metal efflux system
MVTGRTVPSWTLAALTLALAAGCAVPGGPGAFGEMDRIENAAGYASAERKLPELGEKATLDDHLRYAALNNPGLEAAFNRWKATLARVPQVTALPDPRFSYKYFVERIRTRTGSQRHGVGISQTFPWFGKLSERGGAALAEANAERERFELAKLRLVLRVKSAWYELYYLGRATAVLRENRDLVKQLEKVVRARYRAATGEHQDVIRSQIELHTLDDRLRALQELRVPLAARLNAALNRAPDAALALPTSIPDEKATVSDTALLASLRVGSPELRALRHRIAKEQRAVALAKKSYFPDVTFGLDFIDINGGSDPVIASVSVNVPIWYRKYRAAEREARARLRAAALVSRERENTLAAEAKMMLYGLHDAERKIALYRDTLIPKATQSIKTTQKAYSSNKASFLDLIDAERIVLEFRLSHERARTDRALKLAELDALTGAGGEQ